MKQNNFTKLLSIAFPYMYHTHDQIWKNRLILFALCLPRVCLLVTTLQFKRLQFGPDWFPRGTIDFCGASPMGELAMKENDGKIIGTSWEIIHAFFVITVNIIIRIAGTLRRTILLHFGLVFFRFAYGRDRTLRCSWLLDFWDPWEPL